MERNIVRLHVLLLVIFSSFILAPMITHPDHADVAQNASRIGIATINGTVAIDLLRRGERRWHLVILTVPVALVWAIEVHAVMGDVSAALAIMGFSLSAARLLRRRWAVVAFLLVGVPYVWIRAAAGGSPSTIVDDYLLGTAMSLATIAFVEALEIAIGRAAQADARLAEFQSALHRQWSEERAVAAAGRILHDDVLVALRMLQEETAAPAAVQRACRRAVRSVEDLADAAQVARGNELPPGRTGPGGSSDIQQLIRHLTEHSSIAVLLEVIEPFSVIGLDRGRLDAIRRAVMEAIRNVEHHAGQAEATVRVAGTTEWLTIEVIDHGPGLPAGFTAGYGIRHSILAPIHDAGGLVSMSGTPGGGTTVRLDLPRESATDVAPLVRNFNLTRRATRGTLPLQTIAWPVALAWIYLGVRYSLEWPRPWVSLALVVLYLATTIVIARRMERRAPTPWSLVLTLTWLVVLAVAGSVVAPDGALLDYRSWFVGWIAVPMMLIVVLLPVRIGALVIASQVVVILADWLLRPGLSAGAIPLGSVNAVVTAPMATLVLGHFLRRVGSEIEGEELEIDKASLELAMGRSLAHVEALHLEYTRRVVIPWLQSVVDAAPRWDRDAIAAQAMLFATEVRDDLYAPGFLHDELRKDITEFRSRGGRLELRPGFPPRGGAGPVGGVLSSLVREVPGSHRIIVSPRRDGALFRAVVTPAIATGSLDEDVSVDSDEFRTVITLRDRTGLTSR